VGFAHIKLHKIREELDNMAKKSVFGLDENIAGMLSYALFFFSGIVILVMERENKTVRFHALQSILWFVFLSILNQVVRFLAWLPLLGGLLANVVWLVTVVSWAYLMYMAFVGKKFKIPMFGDIAESQVNR